MKRVNLKEMFTVPKTYKPPIDSELCGCTEYPNLNSFEYRLKESPTFNSTLSRFYEVFDINVLGNVAVGCNDYRSRVWSGGFWGFESINDIIGDPNFKPSYRSPLKSCITNIKYIDANLILVTDANGNIELWSTQAEVRSPLGYCLFKIADQSEHFGIIESMDVFHLNNLKAVTGGNDGCVKLWDMGKADLYSINTYHYGHSNAVTGLSTKYDLFHENVFVSCSRDRNLSIWDDRCAKPIVGGYKQHKYALTTVYWSSEQECTGGHIFVGDESGKILIVDIRNTAECLQKIDVFDVPVHRIKFKNSKFVVLGCTNEVKVYNWGGDKGDGFNATIIYQNSNANDYVRDVCWYGDNEFCTIGWDSKFKKHKI